MSIRQLAAFVVVDPSHLSRILRKEDYKSVSPLLASRVARALGLDWAYFVETREGVVVDKVSGDPKLRDRLFDELAPKRSPWK